MLPLEGIRHVHLDDSATEMCVFLASYARAREVSVCVCVSHGRSMFVSDATCASTRRAVPFVVLSVDAPYHDVKRYETCKETWHVTL